MITANAIGTQAYNALVYPFQIKNDKDAKQSSKTIALSRNLGFPKGIAIRPIIVIDIRVIKDSLW
jgi:hypothetical protein